MNTLKNALNWAFLQLKTTSPRLDAEILLSYVINQTKEHLYGHPNQKLTKNQVSKFRHLIARRKKYEPIAYIIGSKEFYGLTFKVNQNVLIPRPETEMLVEEALNILKEQQDSLLIDIGTGSGCIPIAIAKNIKQCLPIFAIDISPQALKIALQNAKLNKIDKKIKFLQGDMLAPVAHLLKTSKKNIIITANLPYLTTTLYKTSLPDVKLYEPKDALCGGIDGLKYYRKLFSNLKKINIFSQITILLEIDPSQKELIKTLIKNYFSEAKIEIKKDLAKQDRMVKIIILYFPLF